jgi:hypothetical protein
MQVPATTEQQQAPTAQKLAKKQRISPRVVHAVELLVSGECKTIKAAAEKANLTREGLSKALSKVHVAAYLEQQTRVMLARLQAPAVGTLAKLLAEAASEHVQNDVAKHVLAIAGHKPKADAQVSVNIDIKAGYVIDLTDESQRGPMIDVTHD